MSITLSVRGRLFVCLLGLLIPLCVLLFSTVSPALPALSAQRPRSSAWRVDVVALLTVHGGDLAWVTRLPLHSVHLAVYLKKRERECEGVVPAEAAHALALCQHSRNAAGRDLHSLLLFVSAHYHDLPRLLLVGHDHAPYQWQPLFSMTSTKEVGAWVARVESQPLFREPETCMCVIVEERHFRPCEALSEAETRTLLPAADPNATCYGVWWKPASWLLDHVLDANRSAWTGGSIRWPSEATLAIPAVAVLRRPRGIYSALLGMVNATAEEGSGGRRELPDGQVRCASQAASPNSRAHTAQLVLRFNGDRVWPGERLGHVLERLVFAIFDVGYAP